MVKKGMFAHLRVRSLDGLFFEMFVKFFDNVVVAGHKICWIIVTIMQIDKAFYVKAFLEFHSMHHTGLVAVAETTKEAHEP